MTTRAKLPVHPQPPSLTAYGRRALRAPLVLGGLALVAILCIPVSQYMGLARPTVSTASDQAEEGLAAVTLPVRVQGLEAAGRVTEPADQAKEQARATRYRIAVNILLRSGYLTSAALQTDAVTGRTVYSVELQPEIDTCATPQLTEAEQEAAQAPARRGVLDLHQARTLAIAAVAVEKFNRTAAQRALEWGLARSALALTGRLPDLSLGPAQIRPSTFRRLVANGGTGAADWGALAGDEQALAAALADECQSLGMAAGLMRMAACTDCGDHPAVRAVMAYGGQRRRTDATVDYTAIVLAIASMLN